MINFTGRSSSLDFIDRLSTKITIAAVVSLFALAAAITVLVNSGIRNMQYLLYTSSRQALSAQARQQLQTRASDIAATLGQFIPSEPTITSIELLQTQLGRLELGEGTKLFLIDGQGNLIAVTDEVGVEWTQSVHQAYQAVRNDESNVIEVNVGGEAMWIAFAPLSTSGLKLLLVSSMSTVVAEADQLANRVWHEADRTLSYTLMLTLAVALIGLIGLPLLLDRMVSRRVSALISGVRAISAGNLEVRVTAGADDELGLLAEAFNQMTAELKRRSQSLVEAYQELQEHKELLEQRVAERTLEISRLHSQAEQRRREIEVLYQADEELHRHLRLDQVIQALVDVCIDLIGADKAIVLVWEASRERLALHAWRNFEAESLHRMGNYPAQGGVATQVFNGGRAVAYEDARQLPWPENEITEREGIASLLSLPISINAQIFGVFEVAYTQPRTFSVEDIRLFSALAQRAAIALENASLYEQAEQVATLEERQRLARELHDAVAQSLYSLVLLSEAGKRYAGAGNLEQVAHHLKRLGESARHALKEMRLLVYELRPLALQEAGLGGALAQRLEAVEKRAGIRARLSIEGNLSLPGKVEQALYRIAQEALNNSLKYAHAQEALVQIRRLETQVELEVSDDGAGFDPGSPEPGGVGLKSMLERAEQLGGTLTVISDHETGTRIKVVIPLTGSPRLQESI